MKSETCKGQQFITKRTTIVGIVKTNLNSESRTLYGNSVVNEICWIENRLYKFKASTEREREREDEFELFSY